MTKPHNPWEEFLNNCATGDNHFRSSEYQELIDFIDGIQAENATLRQESVALKEQVAQLEEQLDLQIPRGILQQQQETIATLQAKSAALVDAIGGRWGWNASSGSADWLTYEGETIGAKFAADEINAALAAFQGEK